MCVEPVSSGIQDPLHPPTAPLKGLGKNANILDVLTAVPSYTFFRLHHMTPEIPEKCCNLVKGSSSKIEWAFAPPNQIRKG